MPPPDRFLSELVSTLGKQSHRVGFVRLAIPARGALTPASETSVNAVLAFIEAAEPRNEIEAAFAIQMACTHAVTIAVLSRAGELL